MRRVLAGIAAAVVALTLCSPGVASAGTAWTIQPVPVPSNARATGLTAVSCWSRSGCMAVGGYHYRKHGSRTHAIAEQWNGTAWTQQARRKPGAFWYSQLNGVSCPSPRSCIAVGYGAGVGGLLAEHWDGTAWALQAPAMPAGASTGSFSAVSCTAATRCFAVGSFFRPKGGSGAWHPLAEHWDGRAWVLQAVPSPSRFNPGLASVSCASATSCMAVGDYAGATGGLRYPFDESWDGSGWTLAAMPVPSGANAGLLITGDSCGSAASCVATGYYYPGDGDFQALTWSWDGSTWTLQPSPAVPGGFSALRAVSCVSAASCTAVGQYARGSLAEYWNGSSWHQRQTTHPAAHNLLFGVSCLTPDTCTAVGLTRRPGVDRGPTQALAEQE
jgi:hypothetical protein